MKTMAIKAITFVFAGMSALSSFADPTPRQNWVSIYDGHEVQFSRKDRATLLQALQAFGIDHEQDTDSKEILVHPTSQSEAQDLVSKYFKQSSHAAQPTIR